MKRNYTVVKQLKIEYDYETARQLQNGIIDFKKVCRELIFDEHKYEYSAYLCIGKNNIEIPLHEVQLSENKVEIPTKFLPYTYKKYVIRTGPYDFYYDLPIKFIKKIIIDIF